MSKQFKSLPKIIFIFLFIFFVNNSFSVELSTDTSDLVEVIKINQNIKIDIKYATANNFTKQILYSSAKCYLRKAVAEKLDKLQKN